MTVLWLDTETFSEIPIEHGTYKYVENCEVMVVTYAINDGPSKIWDLTTGVACPADLATLFQRVQSDDSILVYAWNVLFDRNVLRYSRNLRVPIPLTQWRCAMVQAMEHSLPGGLAKVCAIMGVPEDQRKLRIGRSLIYLFCKPRPANNKLRRATRATHPDEWNLFLAYARTDIDAMRECVRRLPAWNYPTPAMELAVYQLDQRINDRGAYVDIPLAQAALAAAEREKKRLAGRVVAMTNGEVEASTQRDKLLLHIANEYGLHLDDLKADTVERYLKYGPDMPEVLRELLVNRQQASQTSPAKYTALLRAVNSDGRLRGILQIAGALRTRRWAGRVFQSQNLLRTPKYLKLLYDAAAEAILRGTVDLFFDNVLEVLAALVRGVIAARRGKILRVADLSNIEGRMLAWLAGETWKLNAFTDFDAGKGVDLYVLGYSNSFHVLVETVLADEKAGGTMRLIGKVQELALGYQGAVGAFASMAALYGINLSEDRILEIVKAWRAANRMIVSFWYDLEDVVRHAIQHPGQAFQCRRLAVRVDKGWLRIKLPSGGFLCYAHPELDSEGRISYMGVNSYTRQWERIDTYGGKLVENCTQAEARNLFAENLLYVESAGFDIVLHTHDEAITEVDVGNEFLSESRLAETLARQPLWAGGLPLAAGAFSARRYRKM